MPRAERDMEAIFLYIQAENSAPARKWFEELVETIESLSEHPQRNPTIAEDPTLRHLLYGNKPHIYRIIYSIDLSKKVVNVIHVRHRARNAFEPDEPR
jgi:plasmid stabilization system protein ParE